MENCVNSQKILCIKIYENPRKGFFIIAGSRVDQNKKNIYIFELYITLSFALCHIILTPPVPELVCSLVGHPFVHIYYN